MKKKEAYKPYETKLFENTEDLEEFKKQYDTAQWTELERQTQRNDRKRKIKAWLAYAYKVSIVAIIFYTFLLIYEHVQGEHEEEARQQAVQIVEQAKAERAQIEQEIAKLKEELAGLQALPKPAGVSIETGLSDIDEATLNSYQATLIETSREMSGYALTLIKVDFKPGQIQGIKSNRQLYQHLVIKFQWLLDYLYGIEKRHGVASRSAIVASYVEFIPLREFDAKISNDGSITATTKYFNDMLILLTNQNISFKEVRTLFNQAFLPIIATDFSHESDASVLTILENVKSKFQGLTN